MEYNHRTRFNCLIVDDNEAMAEVVAEIVSERGATPFICASAQVGIRAASEARFIGAFLDIIMPEQDGIEMIGELSSRDSLMPLVLMSGYHETYMRMAKEIAQGSGMPVLGVVKKPLDLDEVGRLVDQMIEAAE